MNLLVDFLCRFSFGLAVGLCITPAALVPSGFFRVNTLVLLGLTAKLHATSSSHGGSSPQSLVLVHSCRQNPGWDLIPSSDSPTLLSKPPTVHLAIICLALSNRASSLPFEAALTSSRGHLIHTCMTAGRPLSDALTQN